ncbi:MAG: S-layer homology domain-containing protein [bacterium]|jgi:hypothetical protein
MQGYCKTRRTAELTKRGLLILLAVLLAFPGGLFNSRTAGADGSAFTWEGTGGDGSWHTADNWSPAQVPADGDTVIIPADSVVEYSAGNTAITLQCAGELTVSGGCLTLAGASALSGGKLDGEGDIVITGAESKLNWSGGAISGAGSLAVEGGSVLELPSAGRLDRNLINAGSIDTTRGSPDMQFAKPVINNGCINVSGGRIEFAAPVINAGTFSFSPDCTARAVMSKGYTQRENGTLRFAIGGETACGKMIIAQNLVLDGILQINLADDYSPAAGQTFQLLNYRDDVTRTGTFSDITGSDAGISFATDYAADGLKLAAYKTADDRDGDGKAEDDGKDGIDGEEASNDEAEAAGSPAGDSLEEDRLAGESGDFCLMSAAAAVVINGGEAVAANGAAGSPARSSWKLSSLETDLPEEDWRKFFNLGGYHHYGDDGTTVLSTPDGGYAIITTVGTFNDLGGPEDACGLIIKTDAKGAEKARAYLLSDIGGRVYLRAGVCDGDGAIVATGYEYLPDSAKTNQIICRFYQNPETGEYLLEPSRRAVDGDTCIRAYAIDATGDGAIVIAGTKYLLDNPDKSVHLTKVDLSRPAGSQIIWEQEYGSGTYNRARSVRETSDGGFIIAGQARDPLSDDDTPSAYLLRTNSAGSRQWEHFHTGVEDAQEYMEDAIETKDGAFLALGTYDTVSAVLYKYSSSGSKQWERFFFSGNTSDECVKSVIETPDGGYVFNVIADDSNDPWLVKVDDRGQEIWRYKIADFAATRMQSYQTSLILAGDGGMVTAISDYDADQLVLLKFKPEIPSVKVKATALYNDEDKTLDITATAKCGKDGELRLENTRTVSYSLLNSDGEYLDVNGQCEWSGQTDEWIAEGIGVDEVVAQTAKVMVTFMDDKDHVGAKTCGIIADAEIGVSSYNLLPGGRLLVHAAATDLSGERVEGNPKLSVRVAGIDEWHKLNDEGENGDLQAEDGIFGRWFDLPVMFSADLALELYLSNRLVDTVSLEIVAKPELAVLTDFGALYEEFEDTGMEAAEDADNNGIVDFYDLMECMANYAAEYDGIVFNLPQEISSDNGYSTDYASLVYGEDTLLMTQSIDRLVQKISGGSKLAYVAIVGDDEVVPYGRILDPVNMEREYSQGIGGPGGNPALIDSDNGYILTDVIYGTYERDYIERPEREYLDAGVGRVFADNPAKLIAAIEGYNTPLGLENAAVFQLENDSVNWDNQVEIVLLPLISGKFAKGNPESGFAAGEYYHFDNESLPWDREVFTDALAKAGITMIWTHASHMIMNASQGEPITASDLDRHTAAPGHVLIGPGGHSGYSVAHNSAEGNYFAYEQAIVNSCLEKQIAYFAPSVFGLGYVGAVGYHELILQRFLDNLFTPAVSTIGEAQINAYRQYWQQTSPTLQDGYNVYAAYGTCCYGLPTQSISFAAGKTGIKAGAVSAFSDSGGELTIELNPEFTITDATEGKKQIRIVGSELVSLNPYAPVLPVISRTITLPEDQVVRDVVLDDFTNSEYPDTVELEKAMPISLQTGEPIGDDAGPGIYPEQLFWWDTYEEDGERFLSLSVIPMEYDTESGRATLYNYLKFTVQTGIGFAGGDGSEEEPYLIETPEQLNAIRNYPDKHFKLVADINLADYSAGEGWEPIGTEENSFAGTFDGNGHTISDLVINRIEGFELGLFGHTLEAEIRDVRLTAVNITGGSGVGGLIGSSWYSNISGCSAEGEITGDMYVGGLVGGDHFGEYTSSGAVCSVIGNERTGGLVGATDHGVFSGCITAGIVGGVENESGELGGSEIGGLIGSAVSVTISDSSAEGEVKGNLTVGGLVGSDETGTMTNSGAVCIVVGADTAGGLVGYSNKGEYDSCFAAGTVVSEYVTGGLIGMFSSGSSINSYSVSAVTGGDYTGGLIGDADRAAITNCYAAGLVMGGEGTGGLVGIGYDCPVSNSYWDTEASGQASSADGEGKSTGEMKQPDTYTDWDFDTVWDIDAANNCGYPFLRWQDFANGEANAPILSDISAGDITQTGAVLNFTADKAGIYYYLVCNAAEPAPDAAAIKAQGTAAAKGTGPAAAAENTFNITGLTAATAYKAYLVVEDAAGNVSAVAVIMITTANAGMSDAEAVAADKAALTWDIIKGSNIEQDNVTADLVSPLPTAGANGTAVTWSAAPADWIDAVTGAVTRPTSDQGDQTVVLTATVSKGTVSAVVDFTLLIKTAAPATYRLLVTAGTGGSITAGSTGFYAEGEIIILEAQPAARYSFKNWSSSNGGTFADAANVRTTFVMPAKATNITASFTYKSSGGSGRSDVNPPKYLAEVKGIIGAGSTLPVDVQAGTGGAEINLGNLSGEIFNEAEPVRITAPHIPDVSSYLLRIPAAALSDAKGKNDLTFATDVGRITVPDNMLDALPEAAGKEAGITIARGDKTGLPEAVQAAIGDRPLVRLNLTLDGIPAAWNNPNAPVTVSIPYTPTAAEMQDPEHIVIWYIDGSGNAVPVPNGRYHPAAGVVTFSADHFSLYAVACVHKTFGDLGDAEWARKSIEVMASKGIISGTGADSYSPAASIIRADYLILLIKTLGLTADFNDNFADVRPDAYYYQTLGIAKELGIAAGSGNNRFNPQEYISRQDMMVMTARALEKFKGLTAADSSAVLAGFSDKKEIADYAVNSLATLVKEGLIAGSRNHLNPRARTTRAEAAAFLHRIYNQY